MDKEVKEFFSYLSKESGSIIMEYFRHDLNIEVKKDSSPVTIADKKAEEKIREIIFKNFPEHSIQGEEFGSDDKEAEFKWIIDPIDGTKSFISGSPLFGTMICLLHNNKPRYGSLNFPALNEFIIGDNNLTLLNNKPVRVKETSSLEEAVLLTTDIKDIKKYNNIEKFLKIVDKVKIFRTWGDCFGYYLVASGFADVMIDPIMSVWDIAALIPVINGAGGIITGLNEENPLKAEDIIATNKTLHPKVLELLNSKI